MGGAAHVHAGRRRRAASSRATALGGQVVDQRRRRWAPAGRRPGPAAEPTRAALSAGRRRRAPGPRSSAGSRARPASRRRRWTGPRPRRARRGRGRPAAPSGRWPPRAAAADHDGGVGGEAGEEAAGVGSICSSALWARSKKERTCWARRPRAGRARRGGRRRSGSPSRWAPGRRWCGAGAGSPPARGPPCRCGSSPRRRCTCAAAATWPDPTGWAVWMYSSTMARRIADLRSSSIEVPPGSAGLADSTGRAA